MRVAMIALAFVALVGCGPGGLFQPAYTLPSGKTVPLLSLKTTYSSTGGSTMMLRYETALPITDMPGIEKEMEEVWSAFRLEVEKAGHANAIIQVNTPSEGIVFTVKKAHTHVYAQSQDGKWTLDHD